MQTLSFIRTILSVFLVLAIFISIFIMGFYLGKTTDRITIKSLHPLILESKEVPSPKDRIQETEFQVYQHQIIINTNRTFRWSQYEDTNSMVPTLDNNHNGIEVVPESPLEIQKGDIISFKYENYTIVHRVIGVYIDENNKIYYKTQGDNLLEDDNIKIYFEDVTGILVGILY